MLQHKMYAMNTFFRKKEHRKWTWASPRGVTKNEIDFIISDKKQIIKDVNVLNKLSVGRDHRAVRAKVIINMRKERTTMIKKKRSSLFRVHQSNLKHTPIRSVNL